MNIMNNNNVWNNDNNIMKIIWNNNEKMKNEINEIINNNNEK